MTVRGRAAEFERATHTLAGVTIVYVAALACGVSLLVFSLAWARRTRHERRIWRHEKPDTSRTAIVLELEAHVLDLERHDRPPVEAR